MRNFADIFLMCIWHLPVVTDRCFLYDAVKREKAMSNVLSRLNKDAQEAVTSIVTLPSGAKTGMSDIGLAYIVIRYL